MSTYSVLMTKKVAPELVKKAKAQNVELHEIDFIDVVPCDEKQKVAEIAAKTTAIVFTSKNSVNIVSELLEGKKPDWKIFCIEGATSRQAAEYFGKNAIVATAGDAEKLAKVIVNKEHRDIVFFCGDRRRDELPDDLQNEDVNVEEVVVYETRLSPEEIGRHFDGIAFFSPSAVQSFFSVNVVDDKTVFFSIGTTTTTSLKKFARNKIITCQIASEENMVATILSNIK